MTDWRAHAACRGRDPEWWFPRPGSTGSQALRICAGCPVARDCLAEQMDREGGIHHADRHGIWGGLSPRQRYALARKGEGKRNGN